MHEFQRIGRLFSSADQPIEGRLSPQHETMKISAATDDKTIVEMAMPSSYLTSQADPN